MAGCTLVFILSMGVYLTPVIMGGNFVVTLPMLIEDAVRNRYNCSEASAMALLLLIAIGIMIGYFVQYTKMGKKCLSNVDGYRAFMAKKNSSNFW